MNEEINRLIKEAGALKVVAVSIDSAGGESIGGGGGTGGGGNVTINVSTLATLAEQSNQTALLQSISNNTANNTVTVTNLTSLATEATASNQTALLTGINSNLTGKATLAEQSNQTALLQSISNNTANNTVTVTNLTTLSTLSEQQNQTTRLTNLTAESVNQTVQLTKLGNLTTPSGLQVTNNATAPLFVEGNVTLGNISGMATLVEQQNQTVELTKLGNLTTANGLKVIGDNMMYPVWVAPAIGARFDVKNEISSPLYVVSSGSSPVYVTASSPLSVGLATNAATQTGQDAQTTILTTMRGISTGFNVDAVLTLTTAGAVSAWVDVGGIYSSKFEIVLALGTAATVPVIALEMDYSTDGTAIVQVGATLTGVANTAVSLGGIEGRPKRVRCKVVTAGITLGAGAKVIITGGK